MSEPVLCPECSRPAFSTDQWDREYACSAHGGLRFLAPWYKERQAAWVEQMRAANEAGDKAEQDRLMEASRPWNMCGDHDRRQSPEYHAVLETYRGK